jgi:hypothetical protein
MTQKKIINGMEISNDILKMSRNELLYEVARLRNLMDWLDPNVRYYLERIGAALLAVRRDYHVFDGVLLQTKWDLKSVEIGVLDKRYDHNSGKYVIERKVVILPVGSILDFEFLQEREIDEEKTQLLGPPEQKPEPEKINDEQ